MGKINNKRREREKKEKKNAWGQIRQATTTMTNI